jgi:hypothetical protein
MRSSHTGMEMIANLKHKAVGELLAFCCNHTGCARNPYHNDQVKRKMHEFINRTICRADKNQIPRHYIG